MQNIVKITKSGRKMVKDEFGWSSERLALATFFTPSLREILKIFGKSILILKTRGDKQISNSPIELEDLGATFDTKKDNSCFINYDSSSRKINRHAPLNRRNIKRILTYLDNYQIKDCAVEYLMIRIKDKHLKKIVEENFQIELSSNIFYAELKLVMCEGDLDRTKWEDTPYNKMVLAPLGFKRSILHCFKLIDDGQIWQVPRARRFYFINWEPQKKSVDLNQLRSPIEIASVLKSCLIPYGYVKYYKPTKENKLQLTKIE